MNEYSCVIVLSLVVGRKCVNNWAPLALNQRNWFLGLENFFLNSHAHIKIIVLNMQKPANPPRTLRASRVDILQGKFGAIIFIFIYSLPILLINYRAKFELMFLVLRLCEHGKQVVMIIKLSKIDLR